MQILSDVIIDYKAIPVKYTCDGEDISPPLTFKDIPENTKSLALIVDDPDSPTGTFTHWLLYNLPPDKTELPEHFPYADEFPDGTKQGRNDFKRIGYGGPCPGSGSHRYFFKAYALDTVLDLKPGADKAQLENAIKGHTIAHAELVGVYQR